MPDKKRESKPIDDDYPPVEPRGYADTIRKRREEKQRNDELTAEIASTHKADVFGTKELLRRLDDYKRGSRLRR